MREMFVTELVKDVLGPRGGRCETLPQSPLSEYITGVLTPREKPERDIDATADLPAEGYTGEAEDESMDTDILSPLLLSPVLDPQSRPHSIGLSFTVESDGVPEIEVCITWARYFLDREDSPDKQGKEWKRKPRFSIQRIRCQAQPQELCIDEQGNLCNDGCAEISLYVRCKQMKDSTSVIMLYLINRMRVQNKEDVQDEEKKQFFTECCVFQPQIRVKCLSGTRIVPLITSLPSDEEEQRLHFLYRGYPVLARGYLCSAVWKEIDPEVKVENPDLDFPDAQKQPPFYWVDGELLPEEDRRRFSPPDVRTEFVPLYPVQAPLLEWRDEYGRAPETRADNLAELWEPEQIKDGLQPLVDGYRKWICSLRDEANSLQPDERRIADNLLDECDRVAERIQKGIDLLRNDDDVRLSFCFAMKAMAVQAGWPEGSGRKALEWHPFQLAFILMCLDSVANPESHDREVCDLLWVPTGAGKTEAYLALAAFTMAYRRRRALKREKGDRTGAGVAVISRYTLRLLTIQQFRRTLKMVTACEYLRVYGLGKNKSVGWRPQKCSMTDNFIWGSSRFSAGLWVGGGVTPNRLLKTWGGDRDIYGAVEILTGKKGEGEPAQVLNCPACNTLLAFSELPKGKHILYYVVSKLPSDPQKLPKPQQSTFQATHLDVHRLSSGFKTLEVHLSCEQKVTAEEVDRWWKEEVEKWLGQSGGSGAFARASRPGYFVRSYVGKKGALECYDFDIYCPNPNCPLRIPWVEGSPMGDYQAYQNTNVRLCKLPDGNRNIYPQDPFRLRSSYYSDRVPIPAYTVDEQVYHRCPSIVIATVDKFARLAFEPRASALFGNVSHYHCIRGYYRPCAHSEGNGEHPSPVGTKNARNYISIPPPDPPDLILQDELHLIEGPLGGLVGIYETAVDFLCSETGNHSPKYIASTATIRRAQEQVLSLFSRTLQIFPPPGLRVDDSFFIHFTRGHPLRDKNPGRLYVGICAPGRGPLTPVVRIWARLLHTAQCLLHDTNQSRVDPFWTLTGYFNAIRELGGARALYRQDIPQRLWDIANMEGREWRQVDDTKVQELSSRTPSGHLPAVLEALERQYPDAPEALFTTSMFGTGVDIPRISLMVVHGQPKTTSAYIQSTGRVGRRTGALVVTFLRATRPRDLNHYEFFCGYHAQLHRFVEPISVSPFAPGVILRAGGPVAVAVLRNQRGTTEWYREGDAHKMGKQRNSQHVRSLPDLLEKRSQSQSPSRRPPVNYVKQQVEMLLDRWQQVAARRKTDLTYVEYAINKKPERHVVLGDPQHQHRKDLEVVYENAPQSLRDIEETCGFQT